MKTLKNILLAIPCIAFIAISIYAYSLHQKLINKDKIDENQQKAIESEAKIISRKIDKEGLHHVTVEAAGKIIPRSEVIKSAVSKGILDTTALAIGILKKQVENLMVVNTTTRGELLKAYKALDEKQRPVYRYSDKYLALNFKLPADSTDSGSFDFKYNASLNITHYWKRNKVIGLPIGSKNSYIDIYSNDPRTTINGVKNLHIRQEQPMLGLRIQGVTSYNFETGVLSPGAGIQFDAGRFSILGSYILNPRLDVWNPTITGRYDLIRF